MTAWITTDGHRVHHAFTGTGSINVAAAALIPGTVPNMAMKKAAASSDAVQCVVQIGHPGGVMNVLAQSRVLPHDGWTALSAGFRRTARVLMKGEVPV